MDVKVEILPFKQNSKEWYENRNKYIGASEIGSLINIDEYRSVKDLLIQKLRPSNKMNSYMAIGTMMEDAILSLFSYYENDAIDTYRNYESNNKIRDVYQETRTFLVYLDDVPFIVSPDGYVLKDDGTIYPVEIKFISEYSSKKHIDSTGSGKYAWQSVMQQLAYNATHGFIFTLISNNNFVVDIVEVERFKDMLPMVADKAKEFYDLLERYQDKTLQEIVKECYKDYPIYGEYIINDNESYMSIKQQIEGQRGDDEDQKYAETYFNLTLQQKELNDKKETIKNYFYFKYGYDTRITTETFFIDTKKPFKVRQI